MAARSNRRILESTLVGCCLAALLAGAPSAYAQDAATAAPSQNSDEIVVTAQRRAERSVDVPISITTLSSDQLQTASATQLSDVARITPALRFDSAATFVQPTIRGVGTAVTTSGGGSNVGIYIDGFYSPNPAVADLQLMHVQNVQVLKGPQGTLFGRNTTGGAILVTTAEPSHDTSVDLTASYARFNTQRYQAYATTGLSDNIAVDIEGFYTHGDGFTHNITTGSNDDGAFENWSTRLGLKWDISNKASLLLHYAHSRTDDPTFMNTNTYHDSDIGLGTDYGTYGSNYTTDPDKVATNEHLSSVSDIDVFQATFKADLGFADFTSYTQYRTEDTDIWEDLDHTAGRRPFFLEIGVNDKTFSQEFLLTSKPGTRLQWTTGLFYLNTEDLWPTHFIADAPLPTTTTQLGGSGTTTRSYAAFADLTYALNPQLFLTVGARYSRDEVLDSFYNSTYLEALFGGRPAYTRVDAEDLTDDTITPRVVLRYEPTSTSSIYASYSQGNKAGIIDVGGGSTNHVEPEDISAYEIGYKFDNGDVAFDMAGFYYDYSNLQVSLFKGTASAEIINAASSEIYGLESQVRWRASDHLSLNAGLSWTHARYTRFQDAPIYTPCSDPSAGCTPGQSFGVVPKDLSDVDMQRTPEWTANLGARHNSDLAGGELVLSGNIYYTSDFFFGPSGTQFKQDAYSVTSLRGEWTDPSEHYSFAVYGNNVFDERYRTQVQYNQYGIGSVWSSPAVWGVEIGYHY